MTALLWCDKMYKNISKKLLHLTIEFFIYIETALINYANSGNCDIMYIPRCVGMVIICGIEACSRYNVLSAAVPGPKAPKAGRSPARDRQTEGA